MSISYTTDPSGIIFNNLPSSGTTGLKYKPQYSGNNFKYADEDGVKPFINAVEIDWNGASLSAIGKVVNTTGESLSSPRNTI